MPSNQQQITEQAKFTYSPLGKAFEKQTKTIEDQGEKQGEKAIQDKDFNKSIKKAEYDSDDDSAHLKQNKIYNELTEEKKSEIEYLNDLVDRNKLICRYKGNTPDINFGEYYNAIDLINKIKNGDISLRDAVNDQYTFKSQLGEVKQGIQIKSQKTV